MFIAITCTVCLCPSSLQSTQEQIYNNINQYLGSMLYHISPDHRLNCQHVRDREKIMMMKEYNIQHKQVKIQRDPWNMIAEDCSWIIITLLIIYLLLLKRFT